MNTEDNKTSANQLAVGDNEINELIHNELRKMKLQDEITSWSPETLMKVKALRKLQYEATKLEAKFHKKVYDLESAFEEEYQKIFKKRHAIVSGIYQPNTEDCDFSKPAGLDFTHFLSAEPMESVESTNQTTAGIPDFWLTIFKNVPLTTALIKTHDEELLKHLEDVRVVSCDSPKLSFILEFDFSPNDFFTNKVLTKQYILKFEPNPEDPFSFDGPQIDECIGCEIQWKPNKDLTRTTAKTDEISNKDINKMKWESFFQFFNPPILPNDEFAPNYDEVFTILEVDYEIGHYLKDRIIPRAVLFFTEEIDDLCSYSSSTDSSSSMTDADDGEDNECKEGEEIPFTLLQLNNL